MADQNKVTQPYPVSPIIIKTGHFNILRSIPIYLYETYYIFYQHIYKIEIDLIYVNFGSLLRLTKTHNN